MSTAAAPRQQLEVPALRLAQDARRAAEDLSARLAGEDFRGWDPYDALSSPVLRRLARAPHARQAAIQALKRSPVNLRPLFAVPRQRHTKALAVLTSAYARLAAYPGGERYAELAVELASALADRAVGAGAGVGWGYDFDVQTRWGYYRAGEANAVVTAFAAHALLDAAEVGAAAGGQVERALDYASSQLLVRDADTEFFAYFDGSKTPIHNANMLVASVFARCGRADAARRAVAYTLERQRPDGAWPYGEAPGLEWVDGFHTAYVLERLVEWDALVGGVGDALARGTRFYIHRLVDGDGAPRATADSRYPLDIHAASSGITALVRLHPYDELAAATADRVLSWTLAHMRRDDGRFAFQRHRLWRNHVPYVRWSDSHMLLALANYVAAARGGGDG